jgi:hypothetical protein
MSLDARALVGAVDVCLVTLDALRYDVAQDLWARGRTPNLASVLPSTGWEERHSPASFTYAAHCAFFAGFLPTPARPGRHERLFAARFEGSETTGPKTCVLDAPDLVTGLADLGYHTICVGGVGFFNLKTPLGCALPSLFHERHWSPELGVTSRDSAQRQFALAADRLAALPGSQRAFLFVNVSAIHQPNAHYVEGAAQDSLDTHAAALAYVDAQLPLLLDALRARGPTLCIFCSDHGTAYGEDGFTGHRVGLPCVWTVPYAEFLLSSMTSPSTPPSPHRESP